MRVDPVPECCGKQFPTTGDGTSARVRLPNLPVVPRQAPGAVRAAAYKCSRCQFGWMEQVEGQGR